MKKLQLENFGVQEMDAKEMEKVDGGGIFGAIIGFVVGCVAAALSDTIEINGHTVKGSDNIMAAGLIGAAAGAVLIPV